MPKPFRTAIFVPTLLAALAAFAPLSRADDDATLNTRINQSLTQGADFLLAHKNDGDHFGPESLTGLELYALLEIGRSIDDPRLRPNSPELAPVVRWLAIQDGSGAADFAFKTLALSEVPLTADLKIQAGKTHAALLALLRPDGSVMPRPAVETCNTADAAWTYTALAILEDSGFDTDPLIWKNAAQWWRKNQQKDGSWPTASNKFRSSSADIPAGLLMLYLTAARSSETIPPPPPPALDPIASAIKKLSADFDPKSTDFAYLYQLQRVASAAGLQSIHGQDWFRTITEALLKAQRPDGSWPGPATLLGESPEATAQATSYALLFLAQARAPVIFSKLDYNSDTSPPAAWNLHPRDAAHLTYWLSQQFDRPLHWQILSLHSPDHPWQGTFDSPILLITGSGDPHFSARDLAKLRTYVQSGGLIFSIADHADAAFTEAILKKYAPLLSEKHYEMRALPPTHELFDANLYAKIPSPPPLFGLSNGIREWWIHSPTDLALSWQNRQFANHDDFAFSANLLRYVTGNGSLKNKLEISTPVPTLITPVARTIHLARLDYEGNPDPEPLAWQHFAAFAPARFHTALEIITVKPAQLDVTKTPVAHITGTTSFTLSDADIAALKKFLDHGGTLLADSGGASPKFTASFQNLVNKLYPDSSTLVLSEIPINDPLYNGSLPDSFRLTEVQYRKFALLQVKDHQVKPRIQAVTINSRHVILFSPEDLTSGLLGIPTWAIDGYAPDSAFALTRNMLLYANQDSRGGFP